MPKCLRLLAVCMIVHFTASAQYYYKDILSIRQLGADRKTYEDQNIHVIMVHSFEPDDAPSPDFFCEKKISKNFREIDTYTKANTSRKSLLRSYFNEAGQLEKSKDSSDINV